MDQDRLNYLEARIRAAASKSSDEIPDDVAKIIVLNEWGMRFLDSNSETAIKSKAHEIAKLCLPDDALKILDELRRRIG
jgi:hypothetical protein